MELVQNLLLGFQVALSFQNLLYAFFGVLLGTLIGVLPGIGPAPPALPGRQDPEMRRGRGRPRFAV